MYLVDTKTVAVCVRGRYRYVDSEPWLPLLIEADKWADYLRRTGLYDAVSMQSNGNNNAPLAAGKDLGL